MPNAAANSIVRAPLEARSPSGQASYATSSRTSCSGGPRASQGRPLRLRGDPGPPLQAARQDEGGGHRAGRRALEPRSAPEADLLQPRRGQRRDPRTARVAQRAPVPEAAWVAAQPVRGTRPGGSAAAARPALRVRWRTAKVNIDYHEEVERHWYSVPYQPVGEHAVTAGGEGLRCLGLHPAARRGSSFGDSR